MVPSTSHQPVQPVATTARPGALDSELAHYAALFQWAPVAYATLASDGSIILINRAGARLLAPEQADLPGQTLARFIDVADRPGFERWLVQVFSQAAAQRCQLNLLGQGGGGPGRAVQIDAECAQDGQHCRLVITVPADPGRSEAALAASEARFARAVRGTSDGLWDRDLLTDESYLSPRWKALLGYTDDEIPNLAASFFDRLHPDDQPAVQAALTAHLRRREPYDLALRLRAKDGSWRWFRSRGQAEWDALGQPLRMSGTITDITPSRAAEAALRDSESRFRAAFEQAAVGIALVGLDGRWLRINDKLCSIVGYAADELRQIGFQDITHPDDLDTDLAQVARLLAGEISTYTLDKRYLRKDGRAVWAELTVALVRGAAGEPLHFISVVNDIDARHQAEVALRETQQQLAGLVDSAMDGIISLDEAQRVVRFNPAAEAMFGWPAAAMLGQPIDRLLPLALRTGHAAHLRQFAESGQTRRRMGALGALRGLRADGSDFPIEASISQVQVGALRHFTVILRDITARHQAELELRDAVAQQRQATQQLRESRTSLRALLQRLQSAQEEERTRVSREIHDELGQLLTGLKMDLRWLERRLSEPGLPLAMNALLDRTVGASALNDQTIATVQRLAAELRPAALDQLGLAAALAQRARQFQQSTGVICTVHSATDLPALPLALAVDLYYIAQEALTNVARHAHAEQVAVHLVGDATGVRLEVVDDGIGTGAPALGDRHSLGLLGMHERARQCGGTLRLEAAAPQGTRLVVQVPLAN